MHGDPANQMAPAKAANLGKGIGTWLVDDVVGLWTGDWNAELVERAEGGPDREPFLLVELVVDRVHTGRDGWVFLLGVSIARWALPPLWRRRRWLSADHTA